MNSFITTCLGYLYRIGQVVLGAGRNVMALLGPAHGWMGLKRWLLQITTLVILLGSSGFLVAILGLVPIKASSGHWPITSWFLNFTMSRSVSTHAMGIVVPALDDPGMVLKGATYYETGCFPCHGNPSIKHPRIARQMTPNPPYLPPVIHEWKPQELFYIVKHGVKFTGMPAWPAQHRDDEVWAIVAFLQKFPDLNEQQYRHMVNGDTIERGSRPPSTTGGENVPIHALSGIKSTAQRITDSCERCHGTDGQGRAAGVAPKLAGQKRAYLEASLAAFARGDRPSGMMEPIAVALSRQDIDEVSLSYARIGVPQTTQSSPASQAAVIRGATIAHEGVPNARIPICAECHGPGDHVRNAAYPRLAGQYADYLVLQLELFANDHRGGSKFAAIMHPIADQLTSEQMRDVATYYESLASPLVPSTH